MNFLPLCTASVCPTISGMTVDRRDHVLMTFLSTPARFIASTFSRSGVSTNGPFFNDLPIFVTRDSWLVARYSSFPASLHDELVGRLPVARLVPLRRQPPRRHRMPATRRLALAAAQRMIYRVHRHAAHMGTPAQPAAPP